MAALPPPLSACVEQLLAMSPGAVARAVEHACTALQEESRRSQTQRQELMVAALDLAQHRSTLKGGIAGALRNAVRSPQSERPALMFHPSSLSLVGETEVAESIESSRLAMQVEALVEKHLAELDRYVSSALLLEGVVREENPLRPAVFAQALRQAMNACNPQAGQAALWMRHMAEPLATDLERVYQDCVKLFSAAKVRPADYRVITAPASLTPRASAPAPLAPVASAPAAIVPLHGADGGARASASGWLDLAFRAVGGGALRDFLFGASQAQTQQPLAPAFYRHVAEELADLEARWDEAPPDPARGREYQHVPAVDRPVREVGTSTSLSRDTWGVYGAPRQRSLVRTRLRKQAERVGQKKNNNQKHQHVDQVAHDPRLLAPVREAIVAFEPSLARLAMHAPRFFGEENNPARLLLEGIAQRSFRYNDEFSTEFRDFFDGVTRRFNALNRVESFADPTPFDVVLRAFQDEWTQQDQQEERERRKMLEAVQFAERRHAEADRIAWELSQRSDLDGVPAAVQDFLYGTWSLVIAHARLQAGASDMDPGGYIRVVADLLWSVKRESTLRDPAHAFEIIPKLIPTLRSGLALLAHPPTETEDFFHVLERLHRPVLKLRAKHRQSSIADMPMPPLDEDLQPAARRTPDAHEEFWMDEGELRACGFEDTLPSDYAALEARVAEPVSIPVVRVAGMPLPAAQADATIDTLQEGCWVDLFSKQRWRRARLTWASSRRTLFMFVSQGGRPHSMTRRSLQRLVVNRLLRPVEAHAVVQRALEEIVSDRSEALAA